MIFHVALQPFTVGMAVNLAGYGLDKRDGSYEWPMKLMYVVFAFLIDCWIVPVSAHKHADMHGPFL